MSWCPHLTPILLLGFAKHVLADSGDDFSNNLFSDLAPLLALFGERVTMQFLSQSMGWADCIILAMAPLGIITTVVSAIRVGVPNWLRAIIGRSRENLSAAEMELMSSTSDEACELWNGNDVVRCQGKGSVTEFICLFPKRARADSPVKVMTLAAAIIEGIVEPAEDLKESIIVLQNRTIVAPNITLNRHESADRRALRLFALFGTILQTGVLLFFGFITYDPSMRFKKDGKPVLEYAFPCSAGGTLILVGGMFLCALVVDRSTTEDRYRSVSEMRAQMIWLQEEKVVSDQVFKSVVLYPDNSPQTFTTSKRTSSDSENLDRDTFLGINLTVIGVMVCVSGYIVQFIGLRAMHWSASVAQLLAISIMTALRAFVRRGLTNPINSEALLPGYELDSFAMSLGTVGNLNHDVQNSEHENHGPASRSWRPDLGLSPSKTRWWKVVTGEDRAVYQDGRFQVPAATGNETRFLPISNKDSPHGRMMLRSSLGILARRRGPVSIEAVRLTRAIEVTMDTLFPSPKDGQEEFIWSLKVKTRASQEDSSAHLKLHWVEGAWKGYADQVEAALSLWVCSVEGDGHLVRQAHKAEPESGELDPGDDAWLREKEILPPSLRLLCKADDTAQLLRDLHWWMPDDGPAILKVKRQANATANEGSDMSAPLKVHKERIVGCGSRPEAEAGVDLAAGDGSEFTYWKFSSLDWGQLEAMMAAEVAEDRRLYMKLPRASNNEAIIGPKGLLAVEGHESLARLYAKDMFSAFMWASISQLDDRLDTSLEIRRLDGTDWKPGDVIRLESTTLSRLVLEIEETGLESKQGAFLSILPPLSAMDKLPRHDLIMSQLVHKRATEQIRLNNWEEAGEAYLSLFRLAKRLPDRDLHLSMYPLAVAILLEFSRTLDVLCEFSSRPRFSALLHWVGPSLERVDSRVLSDLRVLFARQGRKWVCRSYPPIAGLDGPLDGHGEQEVYNPQALELSLSHLWAMASSHPQHGSTNNDDGESNEEQSGQSDSPISLHQRWDNIFDTRIDKPSLRVDPSYESQIHPDMNSLHYACLHGNEAVAQALVTYNSADVNARGIDGVSPMHCAARENNIGMILLLRPWVANVDVQDVNGKTSTERHLFT